MSWLLKRRRGLAGSGIKPKDSANPSSERQDQVATAAASGRPPGDRLLQAIGVEVGSRDDEVWVDLSGADRGLPWRLSLSGFRWPDGDRQPAHVLAAGFADAELENGVSAWAIGANAFIFVFSKAATEALALPTMVVISISAPAPPFAEIAGALQSILGTPVLTSRLVDQASLPTVPPR